MNRTYTHLTRREREMIQDLARLGAGPTAIARASGRSKGTISREMRRNRDGGIYRARVAQDLADKRKQAPRRVPVFTDRELRRHLYAKLDESWSPEQICGRRRFEGLGFASRSTIYRFLVGKPRLRRKLRGPTAKRRRDRKRERIHDIRPIESRPAAVNSRGRFGDWEGDTVRGPMKSPVSVATFVERRSRYLVCEKLESRDAGALNAGARRGLAGYPVLSLTVDRGMEFASHKILEKELGTEVYFCNPHAPWERGQNEQVNRLLRQAFPKGTDFSLVPAAALARAAAGINTRPRKCLKYRTPQEVLEIEMLHLQ